MNTKIIARRALLMGVITLISYPALALTNDDLTSAKSTAGDSSNSKSSLIQIAILLDTSGSMNGLVDQARMQIWNVVNELANASRNDGKSELEVSVFQFGSQEVSESAGYIRKVIDFSDDLDEVSRALFSLNVKGGIELCGEVVRRSCDDLAWNPNAGFRAIFIAGNEAFDQGETSYASVLPRLKQKKITVNTLYCRWNKAKKNEDSLWKYAAELGSGEYSMIDHNRKMTELKTPFDAEFRKLNQRMNESFVWYGKDANKHMRNQIAQDKNAGKMSNATFAARMSSKIGHLYKHVHSDLVDAIQHGHVSIESMPDNLMPEMLKKMSSKDRKKYMEGKIAEREQVRRDMATTIAKRNAWIGTKMREGNKETWGAAMQDAVRNQLTEAGFVVERN